MFPTNQAEFELIWWIPLGIYLAIVAFVPSRIIRILLTIAALNMLALGLNATQVKLTVGLVIGAMLIHLAEYLILLFRKGGDTS